MSTAEAIRRAVTALGTQKAVASVVGRSQQWVSDVSTGRITVISAADAFAIETATEGKVSARELAGLAPAAAEAPASPAEAPDPKEQAA